MERPRKQTVLCQHQHPTQELRAPGKTTWWKGDVKGHKLVSDWEHECSENPTLFRVTNLFRTTIVWPLRVLLSTNPILFPPPPPSPRMGLQAWISRMSLCLWQANPASKSKTFLLKDPKYEDNGMIKVRKETLPYAVTIIELSSTPEDVDRQNRSWKSGRSNSLCKLKYQTIH